MAEAGRDSGWDLVKGLGILFVVLGHTGWFAGRFVYLFHLALFFFVTGWFFNENKYASRPFSYIGKRLSSVWPRYVGWCLLFVLLHNFFVTEKAYAETGIYNHGEMIRAFLASFSFSSGEYAAGALWYLKAWLLGAGLFAGAAWAGWFFGPLFCRKRSDKAITAVLSLAGGLLGVVLYERELSAVWYAHTALLSLPLFWAAGFLRDHFPEGSLFPEGSHIMIPFSGWASSTVLLHLLTLWGYRVNLAELTIPGLLFYPISLLGIFHTICLASLAARCRFIKRFFAFLGRNSFDIMALHFTVFKLLDVAFAKFILQGTPDELSYFPAGFPSKLGPFYVLLGLLLPALAGEGVNCFLRLAGAGRRKRAAD